MAKTNFTSVNVKAIISSTSNKIDEDFGQEVATKTVYIEVPDKKDVKKLIDLGMQQYTPKDKEGKPYFIVKASQKVKKFIDKENFELVDFRVQNDEGIIISNYTTDGNEIYINIIKIEPEEKKRKPFFRLSAIVGMIEQVKQTNPFEDLFSDDEEMPF